ncbi:MAG: nickel-binding protein [Polyangiales bacterium]
MEWVVVEREFPEPLTPDDVRRREAEGECFDLYRVKAIRSYLMPDGMRLVCVFQAPDAEAVRAVLKANQSPQGTVWTCTVHTP